MRDQIPHVASMKPVWLCDPVVNHWKIVACIAAEEDPGGHHALAQTFVEGLVGVDAGFQVISLGVKKTFGGGAEFVLASEECLFDKDFGGEELCVLEDREDV
jgi:hypothetical protein